MRVKVIATADQLPTATAQYAGQFGDVVEKDIEVGEDLYSRVRFGDGQIRAYLAKELQIVEEAVPF